MSTDPPSLSVIIILDDHNCCIREQLESLAAQTADMRRVEIVMVELWKGCQAKAQLATVPAETLARLDFRFFPLDELGRAEGRNFAIQRTSAPLVLLFADDFVPEPQLVAEHLRLHARRPEEHLVGVGPGFFPPELRADPFPRWLEDTGLLWGVSFTEPQPSQVNAFFYGANASLKRSLLERVGPFDERLPFHTTDDYEFSLRLKQAGAAIEYLADARAWHVHGHPILIQERLKSMRQSGYSLAVVERRHPDIVPRLNVCRARPWVNHVQAAFWRCCHALTRRPAHQEKSWRHRLTAAVAQSYRQARRGKLDPTLWT